MIANLERKPTLRVSLEGSAFTMSLASLDLNTYASDEEVKRTLADCFGVPDVRFKHHVITRQESGNLTIYPR